MKTIIYPPSLIHERKQQNAVRKDGVRGALLTIMKAGSASTLDVVAYAAALHAFLSAGLS